MRSRRMMELAMAVASLGVGAAASALTTTWVGPSGGSWNASRHWSHGVPGRGDTAILPADPKGLAYTIVAAAAEPFAALDVRGNVEIDLSDATLRPDLLVVGSPEAASLSLVGGPLNAGTASIGTTSGRGDLVTSQGGALWASSISIGVSGPSTWDGRSPVSIAAPTLTFGPQSSNRLTLDLSGLPVAFGSSVTFGGTLQLSYPEATTLPAPASWAIAAISASGSFEAIDGPTALEQEAEVIVGSSGVHVPSFDPVVELLFDPSPSPAYVGYARQIALRARLASGAISTVCCAGGPETTSWPWVSANPDIASIEGDGILTGVHAGETIVSIEVALNGKAFSHEAPCTVSLWPTMIEGVDVDCAGDPSDGSPCGFFGASGGLPMLSASEDGRFIAFASPWPSLGIPQETCAIFVKDRVSGSLEAIPSPPGATGVAAFPDLSADGRFVTFSQALEAVGGSKLQVWLFDRLNGTTTLVSRAEDGTPGNGGSGVSRVSADGSAVVYATGATNIVSSLQGDHLQVIAYRRDDGSSVLVSANVAGEPADAESSGPAVSADGSRVAFHTAATNLVSTPQGGRLIVVKDLRSGECVLANPTVDGTPANDWALRACDIDDAGQRVVFASTSKQFVQETVPAGSNVYLRDLSSATTTLMTPESLMRCGLGAAQPAISSDGAFVLCSMLKPDLGWPQPGPASEACFIYRIAVDDRSFDLVNSGPWNAAPPAIPTQPALIGRGVGAVFQSYEQGLVGPIPTGPIPYVYATLFDAIAADLNLDGIVNAADLALLLGAWGPCTGAADLTNDGSIDGADLGDLLGAWTLDER
jgi:hypothetical protein